MKISMVTGFCAVSVALFGCAGSASDSSSASERALTASALGENGVVACTVDGGSEKVAVAVAADGKSTLLALSPASNVFALSGSAGALTLTTSPGLSWKGASASLTLDADHKGTWTSGSATKKVSCASASAADAATWKAANGLVAYASQVEDVASTVQDSMNDADGDGKPDTQTKAPTYTVFAIETASKGALALGAASKDSSGTVPGEDGESLLDENDWSYGGLSAAQSLGGGDDFGEWFQGVSDGVSLSGEVTPALGKTTASFAAHEKVASLTSVLDSKSPSVIEISVGTWTFLVPDAFAK